jgi:hypothetical protein
MNDSGRGVWMTMWRRGREQAEAVEVTFASPAALSESKSPISTLGSPGDPRLDSRKYKVHHDDRGKDERPMVGNDTRRRTWTPSDVAFLVFFVAYLVVAMVWLIKSFGASRNQELGTGFRLVDAGLSLVEIGLALFLLRHDFWHWPVRLLATGMIGAAAGTSIMAHVHLDEAMGTQLMIPHLVFHAVATFAYVGALFLFPDGRLFSQGSKVRLGVGIVAVLAVYDMTRRASGGEANGLILASSLAILTAGLISQIFRRRSPSPVVRREAGTFVLVLVAAAAAAAPFAFVYVKANLENASGSMVGPLYIASPLMACISVAVFGGMYHHHLWNTTRLIHRLTTKYFIIAVITLAYAGISVAVEQMDKPLLLGRLVQDDLIGALVIAIVFALTVERFKEWLVSSVDRAVLRGDAAPEEALSQFTRVLAQRISPHDVLSSMSRAAASVTTSEMVESRILVRGEVLWLETWPRSETVRGTFDHVQQVVDHGERIAEVAVRGAGRRVSGHQKRVLAALAADAAPTLRIAQLSLRFNEPSSEGQPSGVV